MDGRLATTGMANAEEPQQSKAAEPRLLLEAVGR